MILMDFFNCGACLIDSQGGAITHEGLSWSFLWRETRLDWGVYGGRGVSAMVAVSKEEAGIQPAPQPNPSLAPYSGCGLSGDVEAAPAGLNPQ